MIPRNFRIVLCALVGLAFVAAGCGKPEPPPRKAGKKEQKHDDWWCAEHGIPEEECSMCGSEKFKAEFKAKGDWCDKHNRAASQCFLCKPELQETFAQKYREKYGKDPPPIEDDKK